jgi:threonine dehydratase
MCMKNIVENKSNGQVKKQDLPELQSIYEAKRVINNIIEQTPLIQNLNLSEYYQANIYFKREDLQKTRSYKLRGAYHKISKLSEEQRQRGIVCASAGNHAQGVALSCFELGIIGKIYMPVTTPKQKVRQVKMHGKDKIDVVLLGDTFDAAKEAALADCEKNNLVFIPPFDDVKIIEGQATIGLEILENMNEPIDLFDSSDWWRRIGFRFNHRFFAN